MATIVLRQSKIEPLTIGEVDSNFANLNTDKLENNGGDFINGTINNTTIGLTTPVAAKFTNLEITGNVTTDYDLNFGYLGGHTSVFNMFIGATTSGNTKYINIGTGGLSGSTTNIALGSNTGTGTVTINNDLQVEGIPSSATIPTTGNNLTNKTYVDAQISKAIGIAAAFS